MLRKVPRGSVVSYAELARATKSSPRAIGMIMKNNKRPDIYPCFRVVKSDSSVGGYNKGVIKKAALLKNDGIEIENRRIDKRYFYRFSA